MIQMLFLRRQDILRLQNNHKLPFHLKNSTYEFRVHVPDIRRRGFYFVFIGADHVADGVHQKADMIGYRLVG